MELKRNGSTSRKRRFEGSIPVHSGAGSQQRLPATRQKVEAEEIVVPMSAMASPEYIYVRNGDGYRAFAK